MSLEAFDGSNLAEPKYHRFLRELGKQKWIFRDQHERFTEERIDTARIDAGADKAANELAAGLITVVRKSGLLPCIPAVCIAKVFASGPKLFRPTLEQCIAFEQVAINLTRAEYQQPYPALVIEFPKQYRELRFAPRAATVYYEPGEPTPLAVALGPLLSTVPSEFFTVFYDDSNIESALVKPNPTFSEEETRNTTLTYRVALNCCLLLTQYVTRKTQLNPNFETLRRRCRDHSNPARRNTAKNALIGQFELLELEQNIKVYEGGGNGGKGEGGMTLGRWEVRPHWRRGHWRRQACGTGWAARKLVFIKPILIRSDRFAGDIADTSVVYSS